MKSEIDFTGDKDSDLVPSQPEKVALCDPNLNSMYLFDQYVYADNSIYI